MPSQLTFPIGKFMCNKSCKRRIGLIFEKEAKLNQAPGSTYGVFFSVQLQDTLKTGKEEKELLI